MAGKFQAATADRTHTIRIALPVEQAMPLFEPEGEKRWADGWDPTYLAPADGTALEGMVFTTAHGGHEALWVLARDERAQGNIEYVRLTPGHWLALIAVHAQRESDRVTRVDVRYRYTGLSPEGNAYVRNMTPEHFAEFIGTWEDAIRLTLERSKP